MFYKPGEDTVILVYVDDIFVDGRKKHMDAFFKVFQTRFKTTVWRRMADGENFFGF